MFVAGCSQMSLREDFGRSTKTNRLLQTVNPAAKEMNIPTATLDGQKAEKVVNDYRKGTATAPDEVLTQ
jgi:type IV pilus biogenesis protein CpaD/CtpE